MTRKTLWICVAAIILASAATAAAETRLFVPQFRYGPGEDTQFLAVNESDRETVLDLWAFTDSGELLGQFQLQLRPHSTRALMLGEALQLGGRQVTGWIGATSSDNGVQLSYSWIRDGAGSGSVRTFDAQEWTAKETRLAVIDASKDVVRISNPNPFPAQITLTGRDAVGRFLATRDVTVGAFSQLELPISAVAEYATQVSVLSNADVLSAIDERRGSRLDHALQRERPAAAEEQLALLIDTEEALGAYQVTLRFDPRAVQFSARDVEGGAADGFESRPLAVNIDNVAGEITLASFQVGARPNGRIPVARLNVNRLSSAAPRFGIRVDEITNLEGESLSGTRIAVGLVRLK